MKYVVLHPHDKPTFSNKSMQTVTLKLIAGLF